jgi:hypothetical protein
MSVWNSILYNNKIINVVTTNPKKWQAADDPYKGASWYHQEDGRGKTDRRTDG